jgi:hypothetical protein
MPELNEDLFIDLKLTEEELIYAKKILYFVALYLRIGIKMDRIVLILKRVLNFCQKNHQKF